MTPHDPIILEYRGSAHGAEGADDEYGFIHELFGWFLLTLLVVGMFAGTILGLSLLASALH